MKVDMDQAWKIIIQVRDCGRHAQITFQRYAYSKFLVSRVGNLGLVRNVPRVIFMEEVMQILNPIDEVDVTTIPFHPDWDPERNNIIVFCPNTSSDILAVTTMPEYPDPKFVVEDKYELGTLVTAWLYEKGSNIDYRAWLDAYIDQLACVRENSNGLNVSRIPIMENHGVEFLYESGADPSDSTLSVVAEALGCRFCNCEDADNPDAPCHNAWKSDPQALLSTCKYSRPVILLQEAFDLIGVAYINWRELMELDTTLTEYNRNVGWEGNLSEFSSLLDTVLRYAMHIHQQSDLFDLIRETPVEAIHRAYCRFWYAKSYCVGDLLFIDPENNVLVEKVGHDHYYFCGRKNMFINRFLY